jgi:erythromycin esterase-like protein
MVRSVRNFVAILAVGISVGSGAQAPSVIAWVRANAIRLTTVEAGHGFDDLQPLRRIIGTARMVTLGEATHGSREFFQLKHRLLEFLATEMGFTIFSIEANMPEAYRLNDYVLNGAGDPAQLLRGMYFWTWDTEEVLDMIRWMREFNKSGKGRVQFTGFDMQFPNVAADIVRDFVARYDPDYLETVRNAATMANSATSAAGSSFGVATGTFPVQPAAGKKVRFSGYIKTEGITRGFAGLWWRVDGPSGVLAFDNMQSRGPKGSSDWTLYVIELPVDVTARNINFGVLMPADGTAWFDDLRIELDGRPYTEDDRFDLGFESDTPRGFFVGGSGYNGSLDRDVVHGGKQSLRLKYIGSPSGGPGPDAKAVVPRWQDILTYLDAGRARYRSRGATDSDIDWAIQNARVVLQAMQMRTGEIGRDRSMATNIKWIADHNPNAKMVVWAHNGHVAASGLPTQMMGSALRNMFGKEMIVFGFAFNQGSFQAMPQGGGSLKNFTVPPAKPDTLDSILAASMMPLFALDLRNAPAWFNEAHGSRQIGAMYPDGDPYALVADIAAAKAFDVLLFVESTTPARKNPGR